MTMALKNSGNWLVNNMELKEAIEILKKKKEEKEKLLNKVEKTDCKPITRLAEVIALDTVLKVLDMPEEEVVFYGTRSAGKTLKAKRTYEVGLIVGTKRERVYWESKIKEKIEEVKSRRCDDVFDLQAFMYEQEVIIKELEELLKGE